MTASKFQEISIEKLGKCPVEELKDEAIKYNDIFDDTSDFIFSAIMFVLEKRMKEDSFIAFCETL